MKLSKPIILRQNPYTDPVTNTVVEPVPFMMDNLDITYVIQPSQKLIYAQIVNIPKPIVLFHSANFPSDSSTLSLSTLEKSLTDILGVDPQTVLQDVFPKTVESDPNGPGSILSSMISFLGIKVTPGCSCTRHAIEMNEKGPEWCEQNIDIIVGWLREESEKRKLPFIETVARLLVQRAIKISKKLKAKQESI